MPKEINNPSLQLQLEQRRKELIQSRHENEQLIAQRFLNVYHTLNGYTVIESILHACSSQDISGYEIKSYILDKLKNKPTNLKEKHDV